MSARTANRGCACRAAAADRMRRNSHGPSCSSRTVRRSGETHTFICGTAIAAGATCLRLGERIGRTVATRGQNSAAKNARRNALARSCAVARGLARGKPTSPLTAQQRRARVDACKRNSRSGSLSSVLRIFSLDNVPPVLYGSCAMAAQTTLRARSIHVRSWVHMFNFDWTGPTNARGGLTQFIYKTRPRLIRMPTAC